MVGCAEEQQSKVKQNNETTVQSENNESTQTNAGAEINKYNTKQYDFRNKTSSNSSNNTSSTFSENYKVGNDNTKAESKSSIVENESSSKKASSSSNNQNYNKKVTKESTVSVPAKNELSKKTRLDNSVLVEQESSDSTGYVYANGERDKSNKYHSTPTAHRMEGAIKMTRQQAEAQGYVACKKCF